VVWKELHRRVADYALRGWPDRKGAITTAVRLQDLLVERQRLRFEHLTKNTDLDGSSWKSLNEICSYIESAWGDSSESELRSMDQAYDGIAREIESLRSAMDSKALDGPFADLTRDKDYVAARHTAADSIKRLDGLLSNEGN
jgi:hypothetical protein